MGCAASAEPDSHTVKPHEGAYPRQSAYPQQQPKTYPQQTQAYPTHQPQAYPPQQQTAYPQNHGPPPPYQRQAQQPVHQPPPAQHQAPPPQALSASGKKEEDDDDIKPEEVEFNEELVQTLLSLDHEISLLESKNVIKQHQYKEDQLRSLNVKLQNMQLEAAQLDLQVKKEYQDIVDLQNRQKAPSLQQYLTQEAFSAQMEKENREWVDAVNKQEIHSKNLKALMSQQETMKLDVAALYSQTQQLTTLYDKQDKILGGIFDGKYGSEKEFRLESELDMLTERQQRIKVARYKWNNGKVLIQHACGQFGFAVKRWEDIIRVPPQNQVLLLQFATECRNNLVAGIQNLDSAQRYLGTIKFPYCTADELKTLSTAVQYIYNDMSDPQRHKHAMECYITSYKRTAALVQWFNQVINKTISPDLEKISREWASKKKELKIERLKLTQEKIREKAGDELAEKLIINESDDEGTDGEDEEVIAVTMADTAGDEVTDEDFKHDADSLGGPTPLPTEELAEAPSTADIFGNIEELKKQHEETSKQLAKQEELNRARASEDLQAKLARRRSRRKRMAQQEAEMEALGQ